MEAFLSQVFFVVIESQKMIDDWQNFFRAKNNNDTHQNWHKEKANTKLHDISSRNI